MSFQERSRPLRNYETPCPGQRLAVLTRELRSFLVLLASRSYTDPDFSPPADLFFGLPRVRIVAVPSLILPRMDSCDSMFSQALHEGLDDFVRTEYDAYLLPSATGIGKARQALAGSLLWLANGEWAHVPLTGASLTERAGQLSVVVRPSSGKEDKKVKLSLLGSTATHILPGVLSSHLDTKHRFFKEGGGAKNLREFDGDAPVRLMVSKLPTGKLEILRHYVDGGKDVRTPSVVEALDGLNRAWLRVASTDVEPPPQPPPLPQ